MMKYCSVVWSGEDHIELIFNDVEDDEGSVNQQLLKP